MANVTRDDSFADLDDLCVASQAEETQCAATCNVGAIERDLPNRSGGHARRIRIS